LALTQLWVELRVLGPEAKPGSAQIPDSDIRLDAWTELPATPGGFVVRSHWGPPDPPDLPDVPAEVDEV